MHLALVLPLSALLPAVAGHGIAMPRFIGGGRDAPSFSLPIANEAHEAHDEEPEQFDNLLRTRAVNGQCGGAYGSCAAGQCCSLSGYCGTGTDYCAAPDCQINYGPACDGNQKPTGFDTTNVVRTKVGSVPYGGVGIIDCINPGQIAITFDDGPYSYTSYLLDLLQASDVRATFFMTGNNLGKGKINDPTTPWPALIKRMAANGHQIASHSWSHQNQSTLTQAQLQQQIVWNEIAFNDILGYFPTYWRPPYSICDNACSTLLAKFGYHIAYLDLDTEGYLYPNDMTVPKSLWDQAMAVPPANNDWLQDEHDNIQQVVYTLVPYMLATLYKGGYVPVTLGECLNDPAKNWYRAGSGTVPPYTFSSRTTPPNPPTGAPSPPATSPTSPPPTTATTTPPATQSTPPAGSLKVSTTGQCGNGLTCQGSTFGNCCSVSGWCGTTAAYCGSGCQGAFGTCTTTTGGGGGALAVSTTGKCGAGLTCKGSTFGNCCSASSWCGSTAAYCGTGCQVAFGTCT